MQKTIATTHEQLVVATKDAMCSLEPADVAPIRNDDEQKVYERLQSRVGEISGLAATSA